ncbi:1,4-alpha-glucan branching enzyme GlgB [Ephemeroptericola cinctiostellae]|uniref:1,4-alpha-glucan branching enzyme GlgB n=1 Tax=Ephemeroptericola cinctiostellae TaxID=2268024 RepID=A0A345D9F2_9BURK|nr:1,4-alpha-glucan branching protein GlgB [Ephemeroptericola cinctiostellae]AXF84990.1 1,4-alpha-glucan branching enzyme GlgB [Ephemeroptericola cinctiostellae]
MTTEITHDALLALTSPASSDVEAIVVGQHNNVFDVLGLHQVDGGWAVRLFAPSAERVTVETLSGVLLANLVRVHDAGFFVGFIPANKLPERTALIAEAHQGGHSWRWVDPYTFGPVLGPIDDYYFSAGTHLKLFDKFGAHPMMFESVTGVHFAVWAPNASRVAVVGEFNDWDGRRHIMRRRTDSGVWEIFIPDLPVGTVYKYELYDGQGQVLPLKADPFAQASELRPSNGSKVVSTWDFQWHDADYLDARAQGDARQKPMSIYEVHLGSWQRADDGGFLSYDDLIARLIPYVQELGYTHIEVLPITEHPLDASWGYQPTGLFSPTARFGAPEGFAHFVDAAHQAGIGVILDWVPAHFPTDAHGLAYFDGTALYEHEDKRKGFHPDWNTAIFNFGRTEVSEFLMNNALFWLDRYHLDGLRVDAVASMLYLDYSRKEGEWIPNEYGGRENLEAISFLQRTNSAVYAAHAGVVTIAEESTSFPGVSHPVDAGGLGFGFKWNMGFMHDTLSYFKQEPIHRQYHHNELTFGVMYAFAENFVLPLSHDEVVHGKGTLLTKMAGDDWQKFANLRAYYAFMWGYPGKKLLFMGQEFAQRSEWNENIGLDWHLLGYDTHKGVQNLVRDLNHLYRTVPALYEKDCEGGGFEWLIVDDREQSVFAWVRRGLDGSKPVVVVSNLTPVPRLGYRVPMPVAGRWIECMNSDAQVYGGSGMGNLGEAFAHAQEGAQFPAVVELTLPPLSTLMFVLA